MNALQRLKELVVRYYLLLKTFVPTSRPTTRPRDDEEDRRT